MAAEARWLEFQQRIDGGEEATYSWVQVRLIWERSGSSAKRRCRSRIREERVDTSPNRRRLFFMKSSVPATVMTIQK